MEESTPSAANFKQLSRRDIDPTWNDKLPEPPMLVSGGGSSIFRTGAERRLHELDQEYRQLRKESEIKQCEQRNTRLRADMALEAEETALYVRQRESEILRLRFKLRQEQSCSRCGHRFNYDNGTLLQESEWCDVRRKRCREPGRTSKGTFNERCIQQDNATRQAETRTRRAGTKKKKTRTGARKPDRRSRQAVSHNGHPGA